MTDNLCHHSPYLIVYDDVLPRDDFINLFRYINGLRFRSVHAEGWRKVWRLHDGNPLTSHTSWFHPVPQERVNNDMFPTHTPLDRLVEWITDRLSVIEPVVGCAARVWHRLSFASWIYPPGSGLSLHRDGDRYSGAFTYYAHPQWGLHWGGHFVALDPRTQGRGANQAEPSPPFLSGHEESARAFDPGLGLTVFARPNRIVFISPETQHYISRVDLNAGQSARVSVAGFFHRDAGSPGQIAVSQV